MQEAILSDGLLPGINMENAESFHSRPGVKDGMESPFFDSP